MQVVSFLELFDKKLVLWAYGCMQTTLYIADELMRHGGHCPLGIEGGRRLGKVEGRIRVELACSQLVSGTVAQPSPLAEDRFLALTARS